MYLDPGSLMPVASAVAAIFGALLVFWRRVAHAIRATMHSLVSKLVRLASSS